MLLATGKQVTGKALNFTDKYLLFGWESAEGAIQQKLEPGNWVRNAGIRSLGMKHFNWLQYPYNSV